jgi:glycosyltransferase involved in cell wall biosynthesis
MCAQAWVGKAGVDTKSAHNLLMASPRISVLMASHNAGRFLAPSIASIHNQVFRDWEMIIVDDASTDGSFAEAERWAARDSRIRVLWNPTNLGQTASLNRGLEEVRGTWVARQDADDLSHPMRLARQFERVTADTGLAILGTAGRMINASDRLTGLLDVPCTKQEIAWVAPFLNPFIHTAVFFHAKTIRDRFGGYDPAFRIAQDYELWTRVAAECDTANLPQRLVAYRHLESSLSKTGRSLAFEEAMRVAEREARRAFGNHINPEKLAAIAAFREGRAPDDMRAFWALYEGLRKKFANRSATAPITARMHLKAAGAQADSPISVAAGILSALREDWHGTLRWFLERMSG